MNFIFFFEINVLFKSKFSIEGTVIKSFYKKHTRMAADYDIDRQGEISRGNARSGAGWLEMRTFNRLNIFPEGKQLIFSRQSRGKTRILWI